MWRLCTCVSSRGPDRDPGSTSRTGPPPLPPPLPRGREVWDGRRGGPESGRAPEDRSPRRGTHECTYPLRRSPTCETFSVPMQPLISATGALPVSGVWTSRGGDPSILTGPVRGLDRTRSQKNEHFLDRSRSLGICLIDGKSNMRNFDLNTLPVRTLFSPPLPLCLSGRTGSRSS